MGLMVSAGSDFMNILYSTGAHVSLKLKIVGHKLKMSCGSHILDVIGPGTHLNKMR